MEDNAIRRPDHQALFDLATGRDAPHDAEVPLKGGHLTPVVRVGDTVRRPMGPWSPAVHALLRHLEKRRFRGASRLLGVDERGREVLTYIDGEVATGSPLATHVWSDHTLVAVARLLRAFHDATTGFQPPRGAMWQMMPGAPVRGDVVCHNDIAPWNTVFRGGKPSAFLDWDAAAPGPRVWDVAYAAWHWVPLWTDRRATEHGFTGLQERGARLRLLCAAYGLEDRSQVVETILRRQQCQLDEFVTGAQAGNAAYAQLLSAGAREGIREDMGLVKHHRREWESLLA